MVLGQGFAGGGECQGDCLVSAVGEELGEIVWAYCRRGAVGEGMEMQWFHYGQALVQDEGHAVVRVIDQRERRDRSWLDAQHLHQQIRLAKG